MGSFRSTPDTNKHTINKTGHNLSYAVSHMCGIIFYYLGWRNYMEDAHIAVSPLSNKNCSLFAVFDGHGGNSYLYLGAEVATFV